jgi:hypothetical protein
MCEEKAAYRFYNIISGCWISKSFPLGRVSLIIECAHENPFHATGNSETFKIDSLFKLLGVNLCCLVLQDPQYFCTDTQIRKLF